MSSKSSKSKTGAIIVTIVIVVVAVAILTLGISLRYWRRHQSPNDIKSFVISSYNGSQSQESQMSETLTLTPVSCTFVVMSPADGNFAPSTACPMSPQIWSNITQAYFQGNFPTQSGDSQMVPVTGPLILLGVYYKDGTSNTTYYAKPVTQNLQKFLNDLLANKILNVSQL